MASRPANLSMVVLLAVLGCSSTETSSNGSTTVPVSLGILGPKAGACVEVPLDRDANIPVTIEAPGATLKPPGTCGATSGCGHVVLLVNGSRNNAGAAAVIDLISSAANPLNGTIALQADLVDDGGAVLVRSDGKPATATVTFEAKASCGTGTGGTGGTTSTGGTGGSTGGTGGTGGSTSTGGTGGSTSTGGAGGSTSTGGAGGSTSTGGTGGSTTTSTGGTGGSTTTSTGGTGGSTTTSTGGTGGM